jgi:ERCC4-type nuclease
MFQKILQYHSHLKVMLICYQQYYFFHLTFHFVALRFQHNLNVIVAQLDSCDYVVSIRMGIDRKQWSEFSNGSNCAKMTACVQVMCDFYERPCLIIEKDKLKGDEKSKLT